MQQKALAGLEAAIETLTEATAWDVVCFQETFKNADDGRTEVAGHALLVNKLKSTDTSLLIHDRWRDRILHVVYHHCGVLAILQTDSGNILVGSIHLPHSWAVGVDNAYVETLNELENLILAQNFSDCYIGLDANVEFSSALPRVCGDFVTGAAPSLREASSAQFCSRLNLRATNTFCMHHLPTHFGDGQLSGRQKAD